MLQGFYNFVLGQHPNNTVFSFNWHNVRHITRFLRKESAYLAGTDYVLADIGGGLSPYYSIFAAQVGAYICVDRARHFSQSDARPMTRVIGTAERIPLSNSSVDIVLCNQVLEHILDVDDAMREMYRILRPGGLLLGSVPHISPVHLEPYDFRRFTDLGLRKLLTAHGFEQVTISGSGGVFSAAALMVSMDLLLSRREEGRPQRFASTAAFLLSPLIAFINISGLLLDSVVGNRNRSAANLCWSARKADPKRQQPNSARLAETKHVDHL
jgi:SAM-dependent methyltransferase